MYMCSMPLEFRQAGYLKDHINSVHIKSVMCAFCGFKVAKKRRKRMETHLRAKHDFPTPATEISSITSRSTTTSEMRPVIPPPDPAPSQSLTPCRDEQPLIALFKDFQESSIFSEAQPTLQDFVDNPEGSQGGMTSVEVSCPEAVQMTLPVRQEKLSATIDSILLDTEQSVPETSIGQAQVCAPKIASMIRKYHNNKLQTTMWLRGRAAQPSRDTRKTN